jgi:hypothetical protein
MAESLKVQQLISLGHADLGTRVNSIAGLDIYRGQVECAAGGGVCAVFNAPNKTSARVGAEAVWFRGGSEP